MMKVEKIDLTNLPSDVASNIVSFVVGNPEDVRLKHNKALKKIQRKYKPYYCSEEERGVDIYFDEGDYQNTVIQYDMIKGKVEKRKTLIHYIDEQYEKVKNIINKEMKIQKQIGNIREINIQFYREYKNDNLNQYRDDDNKRNETFKIKNFDDIKMELYQIFRRKINTEIDLQIDYEGDMEVSLYNIWVEFDTKLF